ncbi:hypothetical protein PIROE2DRAFT_6003 [Piromyces sp. E2]|nr:hypothetical protein PIROE2DRAFT_6003 [Piromyces sp. E2]|eukprot:OUM66691.1 hypothetical protein PIROE2DRAFT_6003 [Piromyces sp. E2]
MTNPIEDQRNYIKKIILKNNLSEFKSFIKESKVNLRDFNDDRYDILISIIEADSEVSLEIIQFIIDQLPYESLNYFIRNVEEEQNTNGSSKPYSYGHYKTPLFSAIAYQKFDIATLLLKNKADINYKITDFKSLTGVAKNTITIVNNLYSTYHLYNKNLKYILDHGFKIQSITSTLIKDLISYQNEVKKNDLLEIIFRYYIYDNDFILNLLHSYKYQKTLSNRKLHYLITKEKNKIVIDDAMYATTIQNAYYKNWDALFLFFVYDGSEPLKIFDRIRHYHVLDLAIEKNDYYFLKTLLNYKPWKQTKNLDINQLIIKAIQKDNVDITKLLLESFFLKTSSGLENFNFENILLEADKKRSIDIILLLMDFIVNYKYKYLNQPISFKEMIIYVDLYHYVISEVKEEQIINNVKEWFKLLSSQSSFKANHYSSIENALFLACFYGNENSLNLLKKNLNTSQGFVELQNNSNFENLLIKNQNQNNNDHPDLNKTNEKIVDIVIESIINNTVNTTTDLSDDLIQKWIVPYIAFLLNIAIKLGSLKLVQLIIENKQLKPLVNLNAKHKNIENPLVTAYYQNNEEIFKYILDHQATSTTIKNKKGISLLEEAIQNRNYKFLRDLLKYPLPIKEETIISNNSPLTLLRAIYRNDIASVISIIRENNYRLDVYLNTSIRINYTKYLFTPLILSYLLNYQDIFQFLLKYADKNELDSHGYSIIHYAILKEDLETINNLIDQGVDVNYKENSAKYGHSAIDISISIGNKEIFYSLLKSKSILINIPNKEGELPLSNIIKSPDFTLEDKKTMMEKLIKSGSYINFIDINTPLKEAIQENSIPLVDLLLQNDANINFIFKNGYSPLVYAIESKSLSMVKHLVQKGADVNYVLQHEYNNDGIKDTVILKAIESGDLPIFEYLLNQNAAISFDNKKENFHIIETIDKSGETKIFEYLAQRNLEQFSDGITESIIFHNQINLLKILLNKGFNINTRDNNGDSLLGYAVKYSNEYLVDSLIRWGADPTNINKKGESIYDYSYKYSRRLRGQNIYRKIKSIIV